MYFYILSEATENGYRLEWIFLLGILATTLAILTIISKSPIHSVLYLIGLFVATSLYLIVFNMTFMGISYLLVYVGAVSILFLFILMLINVRISELLTEGRNSATLAVLVVLAFGFAFHNKLPYFMDIYGHLYSIINKYGENTISTSNVSSYLTSYATLSYAPTVLSNDWDGSLIEITHISSIGNILYNTLFMNMIIIAIILLLAMVGAIVITIKPKDKLELNNTSSTSKVPDYIDLSPLFNNIKK